MADADQILFVTAAGIDTTPGGGCTRATFEAAGFKKADIMTATGAALATGSDFTLDENTQRLEKDGG